MDKDQYRRELRKLLAAGDKAGAAELERSMLSIKNRSAWSPEYGWLTEQEIRMVNSDVELTTTEDERIRGFRLTRDNIDKE